MIHPDNDPSLLQHLNNQHDRIQFTMETEKHQTLPFLDVTLNNSTDKITTSVFRKPTHTDQYIHYLSNHHPQIKRAIVATLTRRANSICDPAKLNAELDHLKRTFITLNAYPRQLVERTMTETLNQQTERPPKSEPSPIRISIPYQGQVSHHISRLLRKTASIDVTFSSGKTLKTILKANGRASGNQTSCNPRGCIYQLNCNCGNSYIGETSRPFDIRLKEHKTSVKNADQKSALSEHIIKNPTHTIDWQQTTILATNIHDWRKRKLLEAINIRRLTPEINRDQGVYLPNAWNNIIKPSSSTHSAV